MDEAARDEANVIANIRSSEIRDHQKHIKRLEDSVSFYKRRCELLQTVQHQMRDPERTIVCDILANCALLPDLDGKRYGIQK